MDDLLTLSFQKEHRPLGCEDAPPIADSRFLIVCDGLGGSGSDKISLDEDGKNVIRTSAYLGSRILSGFAESFFSENYDEIKETVVMAEECNIMLFRPYAEKFLTGLRERYEEERMKIGVADRIEGGRMLFPSTLASILLFPHDDILTLIALWAGDSRCYVLSGKNGLEQISMDDSAAPYDSLHTSSHMRNCLACQKGRDHYLNWSIVDIKEPSLIFVSSDGVSDYLPSPMTLERVLLMLGSAIDSDKEKDDYPHLFAEAVRDRLFNTIYDDTTLAGAFYKIHDEVEFTKAMKGRINLIPIFTEADEILVGDKGKNSIWDIFRSKDNKKGGEAKFERIWKEYEKGYQLFSSLERGRIRISEINSK